jgi:hypothetical protein
MRGLPNRAATIRTVHTIVTASLISLVLAAPTLAESDPIVAGSYRYSPVVSEAAREVSIRAQTAHSVRGTYRWTNLTNGVTRAGEITCLVVDGPDAWLAGRETYTNGLPAAAAFFRVHDGGAPGAAVDATVAFIADPGQTLSELEAWCYNQNTDVGLFPLDSGNLAVRG